MVSPPTQPQLVVTFTSTELTKGYGAPTPHPHWCLHHSLNTTVYKKPPRACDVLRRIMLILLQGQQQPGNSKWLWEQGQEEKAGGGEGW